MNIGYIIRLEDWHYKVDMGAGVDLWRLSGIVHGHPNYGSDKRVFVSTPVEFDEEKMQIKGKSGRIYQLGQCNGNVDIQKQYIRDDVKRGEALRW